MDRKAFTLIEVVVVIAIIGVLTGLSITGVSVLQRSSRDASRLKTLEDIKAEITRIQTQSGRVPDEDQITWGENEIVIEGDGVESRKVIVRGITKPKGGNANICSSSAESGSSGTVYCYIVEKDGYVLGADKENGIADVGSSSKKFADIRK